MGRFRYRMQSVLNIKIQLETQAKQDFSAARVALSEEEAKLAVLMERKAGYERKAKELLQGGLKLLDIAENKAAMLKMEDYITAQQKEIARAEKKLEAARQRLQQVMQERKMQEKLKERAFAVFLEEEKHQEGKEVDELTSYTYGQRITEAERM